LIWGVWEGRRDLLPSKLSHRGILAHLDPVEIRERSLGV